MNHTLITQSYPSDSPECIRATAILRYRAIQARRKQILEEEEWDKDYVIPSSRWRSDELTVNSLEKKKKWSLFNYLP